MKSNVMVCPKNRNRASFLFDKHLFNCKLDDSNYVSFFEILETTIFLNLKKFDDLIYKL